MQVATVAASRIKPVLLGSSTASDPIITVVPSLLQQVFNFISSSPSPIFLRHLLVLHINHDTLVPNYFADNEVLVHLSFILSLQLGGHAPEKVALDYLDDEDEEPEMMAQEVEEDPTEMEHEENVADVVQENVDSDLEMLDAPPPLFMTPRKKRAFKVKEILDDSFLRRSKRVSHKLEGFKDADSASKLKEAKSGKKPMEATCAKKTKATKSAKKFKKTAEEDGESVPVAMIPPPSKETAPHLPKEILQGIANGFLQIQSETISVALLDPDNVDD